MPYYSAEYSYSDSTGHIPKCNNKFPFLFIENLRFQKIPDSSILLRNYESYDTAVNIVVNNTIDCKMSIMTS